MSTFPDDLLFTREHTWVRVDDNIATIGITDYAQDAMGDILSVKLSDNDSSVEQDESFGFIESAKTTMELISPISGEIIKINEDITDDLGILNSDPYDTGWLIIVNVKDLSELDNLLDSYEYSDYVEEEVEVE
ncbi:MAG: glycine cleavage system protein GcvH [Deltaproteobacteria bacterium]|nr:glycine cleavage system protein GcvH [Deltaproteobacteria bacterium]MBN2846151.1 glycine cleavage system protein GcvH [Deltaproteobacteria bacterium]